MDGKRISEAINLAGSLASITGISLLWFSRISASVNLTLAIPLAIVAAMFVIGIVASAILLFSGGYRLLVSTSENLQKIIYSCFAGGALILIVFILLSMVIGITYEVIAGSEGYKFL